MTAWKLTDDESLRDLAIAEASEIFLETGSRFSRLEPSRMISIAGSGWQTTSVRKRCARLLP
jgi:hypothetical protein